MSVTDGPAVAAPRCQLAEISLSKAVLTPADYAKFTFALPDERYVGLLACQIDPNLRCLETVVIACREKRKLIASRSNGKERGKQKKSAPQQEQLWEVELLDTVLFPEGGGQASDTGTLLFLDEPEAKPIIVKEVFRQNLSGKVAWRKPSSPT